MALTKADGGSQATTSLVPLAVAHILLIVISVGAIAILPPGTASSGMAALNPFGPAELSRRFFASSPDAVRVSAFFCFTSAIPLVIYAAILVTRLRSLGFRDPGVHAAFAGGLAASAGLAAAGLLLWVMSDAEVSASLPLTHLLHVLVFLCGGPAFAVGMGLFAGGASMSLFATGLVPDWVVRLGLALAVTGALSALGLLILPMTVAIPVTRVGGFVWLIAVGSLLPSRSSR
ncbi:MAG TPA: hypothetical protein VF118_11630 [Gemmatimonadaceae bacterium]